MSTVELDMRDLTRKQMLRLILTDTYGMRQTMADLQQAVADLQTAVQGVVDRTGTVLDDLRAQVAAGQQALSDFQAADQAEDANYEAAAAALRDSLQAQVDSAQAAADQIESTVSDLNRVAAAEPTPEPTPDEPTP